MTIRSRRIDGTIGSGEDIDEDGRYKSYITAQRENMDGKNGKGKNTTSQVLSILKTARNKGYTWIAEACSAVAIPEGVGIREDDDGGSFGTPQAEKTSNQPQTAKASIRRQYLRRCTPSTPLRYRPRFKHNAHSITARMFRLTIVSSTAAMTTLSMAVSVAVVI